MSAPPVSGDQYTITGPPGPHANVDVIVHQRDEAAAVKARLRAALGEQCGQEHWVSAQVRNRRNGVVDWRITAYCWPDGYAPETRGQMAAECDGIDGLLQPADRAAAVANHQERLEWAGEMAGDIVLRSRGQAGGGPPMKPAPSGGPQPARDPGAYWILTAHDGGRPVAQRITKPAPGRPHHGERDRAGQHTTTTTGPDPGPGRNEQ